MCHSLFFLSNCLVLKQVNEKDLLPLGICLVCLAALKTCDDLYKNSSSTDTRLRQILLKEDSTTTKVTGR